MIQLSKENRKNLLKIIKESKESFRALIVILSGIWSSKRVMKILEISSSTYYNRINKYKIEKEASFVDKPRSGAPKKLKEEEERVLIETVLKEPIKEGCSYSKWTCKNLRKYLSLNVSNELIRQKLIQNRISWHKPRHSVDSPDPDREIKLAKIEEIRSNLKENEVLLNEDESDFNLFCYLRNMWQLKGKQVKIKTPRKNKKIFVFGAKEKVTGKFYYRVFERKRAVEFIIFLKHILSVYKNKKVYMIIDNYCVHHCKKVRAFVDSNKDRIEFLPLPTYSPEDNDVIERVWGTTKDWINSNYLFEDKLELKKYTHKGLRLYQLHQTSLNAS